MKNALALTAVLGLAGVNTTAFDSAAQNEDAEDRLARRVSAGVPGTLKRDVFFTGRKISTIRVRGRELRRCYIECQKRKNCDGVTVKTPRSRNTPVKCMLYTNITRARKLRGWTSWTPAQRCASHRECSDGNNCNGAERCAEDSGSLRCQPGRDGCKRGEVCKNNACKKRCWDRDGDGHEDMRCGGDDCNDAVGSIYALAPELCNAIDEDCQSCTVGTTDADGDGHISARCTNPLARHITRCSGKSFADTARRIVRGRDCDDSNPSIGPGSMVCDAQPQYVKLCVDGAWQRRPCPTGRTCVSQPDGRGICQR